MALCWLSSCLLPRGRASGPVSRGRVAAFSAAIIRVSLHCTPRGLLTKGSQKNRFPVPAGATSGATAGRHRETAIQRELRSTISVLLFAAPILAVGSAAALQLPRPPASTARQSAPVELADPRAAPNPSQRQAGVQQSQQGSTAAQSRSMTRARVRAGLLMGTGGFTPVGGVLVQQPPPPPPPPPPPSRPQ